MKGKSVKRRSIALKVVCNNNKNNIDSVVNVKKQQRDLLIVKKSKKNYVEKEYSCCEVRRVADAREH